MLFSEWEQKEDRHRAIQEDLQDEEAEVGCQVRNRGAIAWGKDWAQGMDAGA